MKPTGKKSTWIILGLLIAMGQMALAEDQPVLSYTEPALPYGSYDVQVVNAHETAKEPLRLTVAIHCLDRRTKRDANVPATIYWFKRMPICDFRSHRDETDKEYDASTATLTIHASTKLLVKDEYKCQSNWTEPIYIDELCAKWQP